MLQLILNLSEETSLKGMLNQRPNSDAEPVLSIKRTYTYMINATRTHHYVL